MSASAREVRKIVTILFCDLVHSTGLAEGDPEAYRRVQTRFFERMRDIVEQYGGTVEKFIGDEVMAVFGVPVVHEDDALRAVRAAQEMQKALPELGLQARIGINTGEVLGRDPEQGLGFVAGEPVIIAKRLEQGARAGEIVIGRATYPLVKHAITAGPLERIPVKGKSEEIGRRRVDEVDLRRRPSSADSTCRSSAATRSSACSAGVRARGRGTELPALHRARTAGIGKSRLAAELASRLVGRATFALGRCLPYGEGITFWPLTEVLARSRSSRGAGSDDAALRSPGPRADGWRACSRLERRSVLGRSAGVSRRRRGGDRSSYASRTCTGRSRPCSTSSSTSSAGAADAPILLVCLARPELVEQRPSLIGPRGQC